MHQKFWMHGNRAQLRRYVYNNGALIQCSKYHINAWPQRTRLDRLWLIFSSVDRILRHCVIAYKEAISGRPLTRNENEERGRGTCNRRKSTIALRQILATGMRYWHENGLREAMNCEKWPLDFAHSISGQRGNGSRKTRRTRQAILHSITIKSTTSLYETMHLCCNCTGWHDFWITSVTDKRDYCKWRNTSFFFNC